MTTPAVSLRWRWPLFIDGEAVEAGAWKVVRSPYDDQPVSEVAYATSTELEAAIQAAAIAFESWKFSSRYQRAEALFRMVAGLDARRDEVIDLLVAEGGKPRQYAAVEVDRCRTTLTLAAEEARRQHGEELPLDFEKRTENYVGSVVRRPVGVIGAVTPFNFPLNLVAHKLAPAVATGNTLVIKPASQTPGGAHVLAQLARDAGVPAGVVNVVPCSREVGEALVSDPRIRMFSFTGSGEVGWRLQGLAVGKKVVLELGGNAAAIVHEDANLPLAVSKCVAGGFAQAGQSCISVQRILVHHRVYDDFLDQFVPAARACRAGNPREDGVVVGPVIDTRSAERLEAWIEEARQKGAQVRCGGRRQGNLLEPTVLTHTTESMKVNAEEVFGPVVTVEPYGTITDAFQRVNSSQFGLQAGLFTYDLRLMYQALDTLEVGGVLINEVPTQRIDSQPYGGVKGSGLGREGLRYAMEEMTEPRVLIVNLNA